MRKSTIFLAIMMICGVCFSQNPGYMGKHVIFNAEGALSPSWKSPNPLSDVLQNHFESEHTQRYLGLNYFLYPSVEVIVWNKGTVGAGYNYYNSPYSGSISRLFEQSIGNNYYTYNDEVYKFTGNVKAHGFNVYYKQYLGDTRAPLGFFTKLTLDGLFYNYASNETLPQWSSYYEQNPVDGYVPVGVEGKNAIFGLKAELGYDAVFFNCLKVSMGFTMGTTFGGYTVVNQKTRRELLLDSTKKNQMTVDYYVRDRILKAYWFGIKLGVGFVAF